MCLCVRECVGAGFALNTHDFAYNKMSSHCCVLGLFALSFVCMSVCMQISVYMCACDNLQCLLNIRAS